MDKFFIEQFMNPDLAVLYKLDRRPLELYFELEPIRRTCINILDGRDRLF